MNNKVCAQCGKEIPFGTPYYMVGDNFLQMKYFGSDKENVFCSHECICESFSVIELPNDGTKTISEELELVSPDKNANRLEIIAGVYPEDASVNGEYEPDSDEDNPVYKMPGIKKTDYGYIWNVVIDIASGKIENWPQGTTAKTYYKTSDCCGLKYLGKFHEDYAPDFLEIWDKDCGDYIYIEILEDGSIKDWDAKKCRKWLDENFDDFREN